MKNFFFVILCLLLFPISSFSKNEVKEKEVERVESAMLHIVTKGIPENKIKPFLGHRIIKRPKERRQLAKAIVKASLKYQEVPVMLLVAIAYRENSFGNHKIGTRGEKSAFQVVPRVSLYIRRGKFPWSDIREPECRLYSFEGSALCAAALLTIHLGACEDLRGSMAKYASGGTCTPRPKTKVAWIVKDRFRLAEILEKEYPPQDD